jgi:hypothetical protein
MPAFMSIKGRHNVVGSSKSVRHNIKAQHASCGLSFVILPDGGGIPAIKHDR